MNMAVPPHDDETPQSGTQRVAWGTRGELDAPVDDAVVDPLPEALQDEIEAALADAVSCEMEPPAPAGPTAGLSAPVSEEMLAGWLARIVDQDERALAALYDATVTRVVGLVRRIVRRDALVEEVVEDTYFQVWRQAVRYDPTRGTAITWLLAMARSRAVDAVRREARFRHDSLDTVQPDDIAGLTELSALAAETRPTDELLAVARSHAQLHDALMQLGAQPRQLVSLAFFRGLTHEEIADQTALPLGTVKSQIRRALLTLRRVLGDDAACGAAA